MPTINLSVANSWSGGWVKWLAVAVVAGVVGLGVKSIWFDQQKYLVPTTVVPQGANLAKLQWRAAPANLGSLGGKYLAAGSRPTGYALTTLFPGHLVERADVGQFAPDSLARVVVINKTQLGSGIHSGADVAIWAAARLSGNQFDAPKKLVVHAKVARLIKASAMFGSQNQQVEVLIAPIETPAVLEAMASDSAVFLVAQQ